MFRVKIWKEHEHLKTFHQQQEEAQRQAQEQLVRDQLARQSQGRVAELERDLLAIRGQYEKDQLMLEQYDQRVKALENEINNTTQSAQQQLASKDELISNLQEQLNVWKNKYESLAKLYSQLRQEHLNLLAKFKKVQQKAASAQESIDKREKLEKDLKAKNIELADLIRERDRARLDLDRLKGGKNNEIERLEAELRQLKDKLDTTERSQSSNLSSIFQQHNKELDELTKQLNEKQHIIDSLSPESNNSLQEKLMQKDEELEIMQQTMDDAIKELAAVQKDKDSAIDEQIDQILVENLERLTNLLDTILQSGVQRIQDALYELDSPMQAGNQNSSPEYMLSVIEKASTSATDFATSFNNFIADGPNGDHSSIIKTISDFASSISDVVLDTKGITRLAKSDSEVDNLVNNARFSAQLSEEFFKSLLSSNLNKLSEDDKTDTVIEGNLNVQEKLQQLSDLIEKLAPRARINKANGDLGDLVDKEMTNAADAIAAASAHLTSLIEKPKDPSLSSIDLEINNAILAAAVAVTNAIQLLIKAAIDCQAEIVAQGRGTNSRTAFYKKHNRWTEGLISAAKSVAESTNILIQTADGVLSGKNSHEQLIVSSNEVAASTSQLVAASRVKATFNSKTQDRLELASKSVSSACRTLVNQVQDILNKRLNGGVEEIDYSKLSLHENKTVEMEQQVEILKLENALNAARKRLGEIRKFSYRDDSDDE
ncbi:hypothetical protein PACTADRAFT_2905 [Pachysolen tannophilus NRRL Y-2460]|uniref:I/LWEQ domain-containing protein n=1 Tax=Pachysolen tannophilus NRRL Y-2460 TaxID=669874 RepID=A0A1E4TTZ4_PACTA|nr:hypothetical protein PACTADRAFT_2905 [Pachysolen tannophilus NRRL Y-2460]